MSFILDALRKSESERRRDAVPGVTHLPLAPVRARAPAWVWPVLAALTVGLAVVSIAWWQGMRTGEAPPRATAGAAEPAAGRNERPDAARAAAARPEPATESRAVVPLGELAAQGRPAAQAAARSPEAAAGISQPVTADASPEPVPASLPRVAEIRADGAALPPLQLELHVYSAAPASRFVFIDGGRRVEGDRFDGIEVIRITPDGVVLAYGGTQFLLLPD